jgi:hypothetical protein
LTGTTQADEPKNLPAVQAQVDGTNIVNAQVPYLEQ